MARSRNIAQVVQTGRELVALAEAAQETKAAKFKRLANGRAGEAVLALNRLGNLNTSAYEYTPDQVEQLDRHIRAALKEAITRLILRTRPARTKTAIL